MIPVRGVLEQMGATIGWNPSEQSVSVKLGENNIVMRVGSTMALVNGESKTMRHAAEITKDSTYIPLRFVSENLGAQVGWDGSTNTVLVKFGDSLIP